MFTIEKSKVSTLIVMLLVIGTSACTSAVKYRMSASNYYMPKGWIKYNVNSTKQRSGYQLITHAESLDKGLSDVLFLHGKPDFVRAKSKQFLNLAYLKKGQVLTFKLNSGLAPNVYPYQKFNQLSQHMVKMFADAKQITLEE